MKKVMKPHLKPHRLQLHWPRDFVLNKKTFEKKIPFYLYKLFQQIHIESQQLQTPLMQSITLHGAPAEFDRLMTIFKLLKSRKRNTHRPIALSVCGPIKV